MLINLKPFFRVFLMLLLLMFFMPIIQETFFQGPYTYSNLQIQVQGI